MTLSSSFDPSCSLLKSNSSCSITKPRVPNSESRSSYPSFSLFPRGRHVLAITWFEQEEGEPLDSCNLAKWVWLKRVNGDVAPRIGAGQVLRLQELQSWIKVDKAGATLLFEEPNKGGSNVGVVEIPVRLASLGEFGSPPFVADKLVQAEKPKVGAFV